MRYLKPYSKLVLLLGGLVCVPGTLQAAQTLAACLEEGKTHYMAHQLGPAQRTFERCLQLDGQNVDAHLSLAGVLLTQEDLSGAQIHFEEALKHMKRTSPYWSYTYSMLGDIALKQRNQKQALVMYSKSLEYNTANVNSLIGKGIILEAQGNKQGPPRCTGPL